MFVRLEIFKRIKINDILLPIAFFMFTFLRFPSPSICTETWPSELAPKNLAPAIWYCSASLRDCAFFTMRTPVSIGIWFPRTIKSTTGAREPPERSLPSCKISVSCGSCLRSFFRPCPTGALAKKM